VSEIQERMEAIFSQNQTIGRHMMAALAMSSESAARQFLAKKRGPGVQSQKKQEPSPVSDLTPHELELIKRGLRGPKQVKPIAHEWKSDSFKFASLGDTHWGHLESKKDWWDKACSLIEKEKCDFVLHPGDITEGMSGRAGHFYELDAIGATAQINMAEQRTRQLPCKMRGIVGNHDLWGFKTIGFDPGVELERRCGKDIFEYLGQNEAVINIAGVSIMLSHPGDGSSYATSYASQKFVESLGGGEKPNILLMGHHHKAIFHMCRNVAVFETGTMCGQTSWMRGKKIQAHCGFWIIEVWPDGCGGMERIRQEWIPFFV